MEKFDRTIIEGFLRDLSASFGIKWCFATCTSLHSMRFFKWTRDFWKNPQSQTLIKKDTNGKCVFDVLLFERRPARPTNKQSFEEDEKSKSIRPQLRQILSSTFLRALCSLSYWKRIGSCAFLLLLSRGNEAFDIKYLKGNVDTEIKQRRKLSLSKEEEKILLWVLIKILVWSIIKAHACGAVEMKFASSALLMYFIIIDIIFRAKVNRFSATHKSSPQTFNIKNSLEA